jgi:plasmid stabilization system protein ParE
MSVICGVNTSGYKGVMWHARTGRWNAVIKNEGRKYNLGTFADKETAARHYDAAAHYLLGAFAEPNFPERHTEIDARVRGLIEGTRNGTRRNQRSGMPGIYLHANGRYYAYYNADNRRYSLGGFASLEEAMAARERAMGGGSP